MSWPSDLRRTWLQGVFASCILSNLKELHAGHVLKFASTSSKPRSTSPNRSPSWSCISKACRSGELRCCAKHQPCSHLRYARSVAYWALVAMFTVTSSSKWRIVQLQTSKLARSSCTTLRRTASVNCRMTRSSASIASPSTSSTLSLLHSPTTSFMALACERCAVFSERMRVNSPLSVSLPFPFFCVLFFAILIPCLSSLSSLAFLLVVFPALFLFLSFSTPGSHDFNLNSPALTAGDDDCFYYCKK